MPQILKSPGTMIVACLLAASSFGGGATRLQATLNLLDEYYQETLQSVDDPGKPSVLGKLRQMKPIRELLTLYAQRDETILRLRGEFWATVCEAVGPSAFVEPLLSGLRDGDPRWRSLSAEALGALREQKAVPYLVALLDDDETVPGVVGQPTVAVFAATALADLGRRDGVQVLLAHASTNEYWSLMFLDEFQALSGQDFGDDLDAWQEWFRSQ